MRHSQSEYGTIYRQLIRLSWPIVLAFILQTSYNVIDIFWVGRLGAVHIAAVSLAGTVFYVVLAVGQILGSGTVALVSQSFGAKMIERVNDIVKQSFLLTSGIALLVSVTGIMFAGHIINLLGGKDTVLTLSTQYLRIVSAGFFFQILSFSINYAFRGTGDMKTPMLIMLVAALSNIILDPLLIFGIGFFPKLGVVGAALATAIAKFLSFLFGWILLTKGRSGLRLRMLRKWHIESRVVKTILAIGIPAGASYGLMFLSISAVFRLVASFSNHALAALGIGQRVLQLASLPIVGLGVATTTLIGHSLGAKDAGRAMRTSAVALCISTCIMLVISAVFYINAGAITRIFSSDPSVIFHGIRFLRIVAFYLVFMGITITLTGVFRGAGDMEPPMFAGLTKLGLLIGFSYFFAYRCNLGIDGIWYAMLLSYCLEGLFMLAWYATSKWRRKGLVLLDTIKGKTER